MPTRPITDLMDEIAATLEDALSGIGEIVVHPRLNLNPSGLSIDVYPGDPSRDPGAAGFTDANGAHIFTVRARLDLTDADASQDTLLRLMDDQGDDSVAVALMDDQTLNGFASSVYVEGPSGYIAYVDNPGNMIGVEWRVSVLRATS